MRVNFMGLHGPQGVLPRAYCELVNERIRARDTTLRDFFDLFNHRIVSLFYQAWEKFHFEIPYERGELDRFSHHVLALLGLDTPGLQNRQDVADDSLLFYGGPALHALPLGHGAAAGVVGLFQRAGGNRAVRGRVVSGGRGIAVLAWVRTAVIRSSWGSARWWAMRPGTSSRGCAFNWARLRWSSMWTSCPGTRGTASCGR